MNYDLPTIDRQARYLLCILVVFTLALWLINYSEIQYKTIDTHMSANEFPGSAATWQYIGPPENSRIGESSIILSRQKPGYSGVEKSMSVSGTLNNRALVKIKLHYNFKNNPASIELSPHLPASSGNKNLQPLAYLTLRSFDHQNFLTRAYIISRVDKEVDHIINNIQVNYVTKLITNTSKINLGFLLRDSNSTIEILGATVEEVGISPAYSVLTLILVFLFFLAAGLVIYPIRFILNYRQIIAGTVLMGLLVGSIIISGDIQALILQTLAISDITGSDSYLIENRFWMEGLAHSLLFFIVGSYIYMMLHHLNLKIRYFLGYTTTLAFATEVLQLHIPGRSGSITDLLFDFNGIIISMAICVLVLKFSKIYVNRN